MGRTFARLCVVMLVTALAVSCGTAAAGGQTGVSRLAGPATANRAGEVTVAAGRRKAVSYDSIQAAIDAAAEGAVIHIGPGVYEDNLVIRKPVTLEGAGWEKTTVKSRIEREPEELASDVRERWQNAATEEERSAIIAEIEPYHLPTILVKDTEGVVISGMRIMSRAGQVKGSILFDGIVEARHACLLMSGCAITRSPGCGIMVADGSQVEVRGCLIAGVWSMGIVVGDPMHKDSAAATAAVLDCDIRNCHYAGVSVRPDNNATVEQCRVSGAGWHGIRYDNASPVIEGCTIFDNCGSGIYASGETAATVRNNFFFGNVASTIRCWKANHDTIEGNTFACNGRDGIVIVEPSRPAVLKNIFSGQQTAIRWAWGPEGKTQESSEPLRIEGNVFWKNAAIMTKWQRGEDGGAVGEERVSIADLPGNREEDPGFVEADAEDCALAADSAARRDGIGAADPLTMKSPWPVQEEERGIIRDNEEFARQRKESAAEE